MTKLWEKNDPLDEYHLLNSGEIPENSIQASNQAIDECQQGVAEALPSVEEIHSAITPISNTTESWDVAESIHKLLKERLGV